MRVEVTIDVSPKGVDLIAGTAFLTLVDKMGYAGRLLAIQRLDRCGFFFETEEPEAVIERFRRFAATQSIFYNRNKHNHFMKFAWQGERIETGYSPRLLLRALAADARRRLERGATENLNGNPDQVRAILGDASVYWAEVLVEEAGPYSKASLARRLESELSATPLEVDVLGTCWHLAILATTREDANRMAEDIVVTGKRDRGLLANPNGQQHRILGLEPLDTMA